MGGVSGGQRLRRGGGLIYKEDGVALRVGGQVGAQRGAGQQAAERGLGLVGADDGLDALRGCGGAGRGAVIPAGNW